MLRAVYCPLYVSSGNYALKGSPPCHAVHRLQPSFYLDDITMVDESIEVLEPERLRCKQQLQDWGVRLNDSKETTPSPVAEVTGTSIDTKGYWQEGLKVFIPDKKRCMFG